MDFGSLIGNAINLIHAHLQGVLIGAAVLGLLFYFKPVVAKRTLAIIIVLGAAYCLFAIIGESTLTGVTQKGALVNQRP
jgi:hypothetical protein